MSAKDNDQQGGGTAAGAETKAQSADTEQKGADKAAAGAESGAGTTGTTAQKTGTGTQAAGNGSQNGAKPGGRAASSTADAVAILKGDHRKVEALFEQ